MSDIIRCPRCRKACGNTVDVARRVTVRCQFCGYTERRTAMKCACGDPLCQGDVGFDSATGGLLIDMHKTPDALGRGGGIPGVGFVYLDVASATRLAQQLKAYLLNQADTPNDIRTVVTPPDGVHP